MTTQSTVALTPSVAYGASSLLEGAFHTTHSATIFCLIFIYRQSLYGTPPLWRGFRFTKNRPTIISDNKAVLFIKSV